jgi:hypothetical protein
MGMKNKNVANPMMTPDSPATKAHFRCRCGIHHDAMINANEQR